MKKIYQQQKWKKHSEYISRKNAKRKAKKKQLFKHVKHNFLPVGTKIITAPKVFSLKDNVEEMLTFFSEIEDLVKNKFEIYFDMSLIEYISIDAVLYVLSMFDFFKKKLRYYSVKGNEPIDLKSRKILKESGFYNFVNAAFPTLPDSNTLSIKSGEKVEELIAKEVTDFTKNHFKNTGNHQSFDSIYITLVESMENTNSHAYAEGEFLPRWWLSAYYDEAEDKVNFTFLDNGKGIPATVESKFLEKVSIVSGGQDAKLIMSALEGLKMRSRTGKSYRGKGLPRIYKYLVESQIESLVIISNQGYLVADQKKMVTLKNSFRGTLLSWSYT